MDLDDACWEFSSDPKENAVVVLNVDVGDDRMLRELQQRIIGCLVMADGQVTPECVSLIDAFQTRLSEIVSQREEQSFWQSMSEAAPVARELAIDSFWLRLRLEEEGYPVPADLVEMRELLDWCAANKVELWDRDTPSGRGYLLRDDVRLAWVASDDDPCFGVECELGTDVITGFFRWMEPEARWN